MINDDKTRPTGYYWIVNKIAFETNKTPSIAHWLNAKDSTFKNPKDYLGGWALIGNSKQFSVYKNQKPDIEVLEKINDFLEK